MTGADSTLGQRIRHARREAGFRNIETWAVHLGVGFSTASRWETGKNEPTLARLRQIAQATGRPLSYFVASERRRELENSVLRRVNRLCEEEREGVEA